MTETTFSKTFFVFLSLYLLFKIVVHFNIKPEKSDFDS